ncbi:uncharacterized protein LOC128184182 [Crassostrea angulata]|uniref:uncharacterized protein LOC128184182 n=1 Tax=Magallana angulata TaxID=2784310 RepID=UPI0022B0CE81|nr:uncharacterized protein LOC128184182 [Crassostrea angulata]
MEGLVWRILLLSTMTVFKKVSAITFCEQSAMTVRYVEECPTHFRSWEIAAKKMNCESIEERCSDSFNTRRHQFQYHCVINAWRNATLEVCALNRTIFGYCTEYNIYGTVIQDDYGADCTKFNPPCPKSYNSAEAYKYQTCYDLVIKNRRMREYTVTDLKHPNSTPERVCGKLALPILTILFVIQTHVL